MVQFPSFPTGKIWVSITENSISFTSLPDRLQRHTNLFVSEVNAPAENDWYIPLVHTIVFLVHPLVKNIRVQNPASVDLERTHTHKQTICVALVHTGASHQVSKMNTQETIEKGKGWFICHFTTQKVVKLKGILEKLKLLLLTKLLFYMQSVIWCNLCVCFFISTAIICVAYVYCLFLLLLLWYDVLIGEAHYDLFKNCYITCLNDTLHTTKISWCVGWGFKRLLTGKWWWWNKLY